jgi:hypothetical protein
MVQLGYTAGGSSGVYPLSQVMILNPLTGAILAEFSKAGVATTIRTTRWGDFTTVAPDPSDSKSVWAIGSFLNNVGVGVQDQWWMNVSE